MVIAFIRFIVHTEILTQMFTSPTLLLTPSYLFVLYKFHYFGSQYRGKTNLYNLTQLEAKFKVRILHCFAEVYGFKGVHDSAGKEVPRFIQKQVIEENAAPDALHCYKLCCQKFPGFLNATNNNSLRDSKKWEELSKNQGSYGFNGVGFGYVSSIMSDDLQELLEAIPPDKHLHFFLRPKHKRLISKIPRSTTSSQFATDPISGKLWRRDLPCYCKKCESQTAPYDKYNDPNHVNHCLHFDVSGAWESCMMTSRESLDATVLFKKKVSPTMDVKKSCESVFILINEKEMYDLKVRAESGTSGVTPGSIVFYNENGNDSSDGGEYKVGVSCPVTKANKLAHTIRIYEFKSKKGKGNSTSSIYVPKSTGKGKSLKLVYIDILCERVLLATVTGCRDQISEVTVSKETEDVLNECEGAEFLYADDIDDGENDEGNFEGEQDFE